MAEKKNPSGPAGERLRAAVEGLRTKGKMQFTELSAALAEIGRPIPPLGLSRLESGERRVDVDDLVALALVFGVPVGNFLLPTSYREDDPVDVTAAVQMPAEEAWRKVAGEHGWDHKWLTRQDAIKFGAVLQPIADAVKAALAAGATPGNVRSVVDDAISKDDGPGNGQR